MLWGKAINAIYDSTLVNNGACQAINIKVGNDGYVYVLGTFSGDLDFGNGIRLEGSQRYLMPPLIDQDIYFAKYSSSGVCVWARAISVHQNAMAVSLDLDETNNLYIAGYFSGTTDFSAGQSPSSSTGTACGGLYPECRAGFLVKYDSDGNYKRVKYPQDNDNGEIYPYAIKCKDEIYTIGKTGFLQAYSDGLDVFRINKSIFSNPLNATAYATDIDVDDEKNVYITGKFFADDDFGEGDTLSPLNGSAFYVKYKKNTDGTYNLAWKRQFAGSFTANEIDGIGIVLGKNNEVYGLATNNTDSVTTYILKMSRSDGSLDGSWADSGIRTIRNIGTLPYSSDVGSSAITVQPENGDILVAATALSSADIQFGNGIVVPSVPAPDYSNRLVIAEYQGDGVGTCLWAKQASGVIPMIYGITNNLPLDIDSDISSIYLAGWFVGNTNINVCDTTYEISTLDTLAITDGYIAKYGQIIPDLVYNFNPIVTGGNNICGQDEIYLASLYTDANYSWSVSPNLLVISTFNNQITVAQNPSYSSGPGWVEATVSRSNSCINYTATKTFRKEVWVGQPQKPYIPADSVILPIRPLPEPYVYRMPASSCEGSVFEIRIRSEGAEYIGFMRSDSTQVQISKDGKGKTFYVSRFQRPGTYTYLAASWAGGRPPRRGCMSDSTLITIILTPPNPDEEPCLLVDNEIKKSELRIYPNPAVDLLIIESITHNRYELYNKYGQILLKNDIHNGSANISFSNLAEDIYILHLIEENGGRIQKQIVVNK
ncbi:MAG: T9SS type A sorting domain-containing protein [Thermonemataceae bacterium]|nr:T9SS type A sorting domain-containing protein [Thermonemataceae bacterium]